MIVAIIAMNVCRIRDVARNAQYWLEAGGRGDGCPLTIHLGCYGITLPMYCVNCIVVNPVRGAGDAL